MQPLRTATALLPALFVSFASAQLLTQGNGNLPPCAQTCSTLAQAQQSCNGASSTSLSAWSCFCQTVWSNSNGALTTMCATACPAASDNQMISTWYTNNCGSDNGASEHGGGTGSTGPNGVASASSAPSSAPSGATASGVPASGSDSPGCVGWFNCHWKWVVMVIVLAIGLLVLGFGGRWLKKRHDRKRDRMSESFNAGITTRGPPMASHDVNTSRFSAAPDADAASGTNSPHRTRDAFMPYGYGYTRSESRLGSNNERASPMPRGTTPANELEKGSAEATNTETTDSPPKKSRRVMVREKILGDRS